MKAVFVGGGSHRLLGILRGAMAVPGVLDGGEINLYDLNVERSGAVGRMLMKTPEFRRCGCKVTWGTGLDEALEGADVVGVILMAGSAKSYHLGHAASLRRNYLSSDNVSPSGALLAVKGAPIVLDVARRMERLCPEALLLDFANPVPVLSSAVNNHTKIQALGLCAGFTNHQWDLSRLFGRDEQDPSFNVEVAGVNHISYIVKGSWRGRDLFEQLDERLLDPNWVPPVFKDFWSDKSKQNIATSIRFLARVYRELGVMVFSTEGDGMAHLFYDEVLAKEQQKPALSAGEIDQELETHKAARAESDRTFMAKLDEDLDEAFWATYWEKDLRFRREDEDIFTKILTSVGNKTELKIAASLSNGDSVVGIHPRHVLEYSLIVEGKTVRPAGQYEIPTVVAGLTSSLAAHQTMLADAIATEDPKLLAQALMVYPVRPYSRDLRNLSRELLEINATEIPATLRRATEFL